MIFDVYLDLLEKEGITSEDLPEEQYNAELLSKEMGISLNELVSTLLKRNYDKLNTILEMKEHLEELEKHNKALEKTISDLQGKIGLSGRDIHNLTVHNGNTIKKEKLSIIELAICLHLKWDDKKIIDHCKISRQTLYRKKKKIEEMGGAEYIFNNIQEYI